jgi:glycosyltransferase involved in cell wall biosynthesis
MKVRIVQPVVPRYREPLFRRLASRSGLELEVWADERGQGSLAAAPDSGAYRRVHTPCRTVGPLVWQPSLMHAVDGTSDVVVAQWNARLVHLWPAIRKAHRRGVGIVLWGHGIGKRESAWRRAIRERYGRAADAVILYTPGVAHDLVASGFDPQSVFVAPNSLDLEPIDRAIESCDDARISAILAECGGRPGRVVVFLSRLEPDKRVNLLIEAFRRASERQPDLRLAILGDGPARRDLERQAASCGLEARIHFEGAVYDEDRIAPWMRSALCMAYPGPIGLSLMHAFAYGVPVLTHRDRQGHNPEIEALIDGINGLLVRRDDPAALADAIVALAENSECREAMASAAARTVRATGGWNLDGMVDGFIAAVEASRRR